MVLRSNSLAVVDTSRFEENQEHNMCVRTCLLMYCYWTDESTFLGEARASAEVCRQMFEKYKDSMKIVANGCKELLKQHIRDP